MLDPADTPDVRSGHRIRAALRRHRRVAVMLVVGGGVILRALFG